MRIHKPTLSKPSAYSQLDLQNQSLYICILSCSVKNSFIFIWYPSIFSSCTHRMCDFVCLVPEKLLLYKFHVNNFVAFLLLLFPVCIINCSYFQPPPPPHVILCLVDKQYRRLIGYVESDTGIEGGGERCGFPPSVKYTVVNPPPPKKKRIEVGSRKRHTQCFPY